MSDPRDKIGTEPEVTRAQAIVLWVGLLAPFVALIAVAIWTRV